MSEKQHWSRFLTHYQQPEYLLGQFARYDSFHQFWSETMRADHMLEIASIWSKREPLVLAACACARLALPYAKSGDNRPFMAIETTEAWARGEADIEQVKVAAAAAYTASLGATSYAAAYAALAAFYTSSSSTSFVALSVGYATPGPNFDSTLGRCANIVREMLEEPPFERYYNLRAFL